MIYFQSQVDRLMAEKDAVNALLKAENERIQKLLEIERKRAESAIDQVLALSGAHGVMPAQPRKENPIITDNTAKFLATIGEDVEGDK